MSWLIALAEIVAVVSFLVGGFFTFVGSYGLLKLDDPMKRLHAPTKAATLGVGSLLLGSMLHSFTYETGSIQEVLIMGFLFVTAPVTAQFIAKVNIHNSDCDALPAPHEDEMWAVQDTPEADRDLVSNAADTASATTRNG